MQQKMFICKVEVAIEGAIHDANDFCQPNHFFTSLRRGENGLFPHLIFMPAQYPKIGESLTDTEVRVSPIHR